MKRHSTSAIIFILILALLLPACEGEVTVKPVETSEETQMPTEAAPTSEPEATPTPNPETSEEPGATAEPEETVQPTSTPVKCKVTFEAEDGEVFSVYVDKGEKIPRQADLEKTGFEFDGWYLGDEKWSFIGYVVTEDMTLTARWKAMPENTVEPTSTPTAKPTSTPRPTNTPIPQPGDYDLFEQSGIGNPLACNYNNLLRTGWKVNLNGVLCWGGPLDTGYGGIDPQTQSATRQVVKVKLDDGTEDYAIRVCSDGEGNYTALWNQIYNFPGLKSYTTYTMTVTCKFSGSPEGKAQGAELRECYINCSAAANNAKEPIMIDGKWHTYEYVFTTGPIETVNGITLVDFNVGPESYSAYMYVGFEMLILKCSLYETPYAKPKTTATPKPAATPTPTPKLTATPTPTPKPTATPTPTPKTILTVTFESEYGPSIVTRYVKRGDKLLEPEVPYVEDYSLDGWYYKGEKWSFVGYVVSEDMTLTAKWNYNGPLSYRDLSKGTCAISGLNDPENVQKIVIPATIDGKTVTEISDRVFRGCTWLTSITIPNSVTTIGYGAFSGCKNLPTITIPNSVTTICDDAFSDCSSLTSITIPNSVTSVGVSAFINCSSLTNITIPNSVTSIGEWAFARCESLKSVTIPNSVTSVSVGAFADCPNLTIYCEAPSKPADWHSMWNASCPVIWNYKP